MNDFSRAPRVLVVEDDEDIAQALQRSLRMEGYEVRTAGDGEAALEQGRSFAPDLVILDLGLPRLDGIEVARTLRETDDVPILVLTARDAVSDRVAGLDAGADDYLPKPFALEELLARLRALLRRPPQVLGPELHMGNLVVDLASRTVTVDGRLVELRAREFGMLELLLRRAPAVVSREAIALHAWPDESEAAGSNTIDVHAARLRRKLAGATAELVAVRGAGYHIVERA
jgi:two-component system, OmpR family, response regulator MprA